MAGQDRAMDRRAVFEPYDMDTALGTNNSGVLMFSPYLEDIDTVSSVIAGGDSGGSEAPVYNAQDSVLWNNMRDAFRSEMATMYRRLRTDPDSDWNYEAIEKRFEDHQAYWPEAIYNEDAWIKYIYPLVNAVTWDEETKRWIRTDRYLTMLQGSKAEQRKWWLYNRLRYLDSKYHVGNATTNSIDIRLFNGGTLHIKAAVPLYIGVSFGLGTTPMLKRTEAGVAADFPYIPGTGITEMETSIWSANLITDVGDLSVFYPNECNFAKATLLRSLKIGDSTTGYSNANLTKLDVQNCVLLESIDCRNCPNLRQAINLENSSRLAEAYFEGTNITGVELADGCIIETLHLPASVTALTLMNLSKLSDFQIPSYANVSRVMLSNIDQNVVDPEVILNAIPANSQVNIQGMYVTVADAAAIEDFFDLLDTMQGVTRERVYQNEEWQWIYHVDESGPVVSGEVHTGTLTGEQIEEFNSRYPYIRCTADHTSCKLEYYNYDGTELLYTETVLDGGNGAWTGAPARTADAQYTYTFAGWSRNQNGSADATARNSISANRKVYAAYSTVVNTYTVTWKNANGTVLETDTDVPYGTTPTYNGATPTQDGETSTGWSPAVGPITGNTIYTAVYIPMYTAMFVRETEDGGGTLWSGRFQENTTPVYGGSTPTTTQGSATEFSFTGWTPALGPITTDTTYTAKFQDMRALTIQFLARTLREYEG